MDVAVAGALDRSLSAEPLGPREVEAILSCPDAELEAVLDRAAQLRDEGLAQQGLDGIVTYSRKVFVPLTRLCRYRCSYCTFVTPRAEGPAFLTEQEILDIARRGREWGCTEALFTLGEGPEARHPEALAWLRERGFASTIDYLVHAAGLVLGHTGLLPHVNPGAVGHDQMVRLRSVAPSQGLMMEQLTDRLLAPGQAHAGAQGKAAAVRLEQLELAARTRTPFTTGFLIGIGESVEERAGTILAIRDACKGQVQEVIVQNFRAKPDTPMRGRSEPDEGEMLRAIAATRLVFGPRMSVQAPPNLSPVTYGRYLDAGLSDWGGVSPVTPDHVNPEMPWPELAGLSRVCEQRGLSLRQRLAVYPGYVSDTAIDEWIAEPVRRHVLALSDATGLAREERWYAGEGWTPAHRAAQPVPKRRALALAANRPRLAAAEVSAAAATGARCGDASGDALVGFDEMLPDTDCRTAFVHERADRRPGLPHPWISPYLVRTRPAAPDVRRILSKGADGARLDHSEVERLFRSEGADLSALLAAADDLRRQVAGDVVTYVVNRNITYTNLCHTGCGFCGFARPVGHADGYYFDPATVAAKAREARDLGATEVCVQGGIHPHNDGRIYLEIAAAIKQAVPDIHLHGFSPLEVTVGARTLGLPLSRYIPMLAEAGLDSMPGTAAEILDERVRPKITPEKLSAGDWLEVMRTAHRCGIRSTSTIMFGHVDDPAAWAGHLLSLRDLQAETGGFTEIVPLPFVHHRSPIFMRGGSRSGPTWRECLKMHAVARVALHPLIPNVQGSWVKMGAEGVVATLHAGVNDFGGTLMEEHISRMAGASHGLGVAVGEIRSAIRRAGRTPSERTTTYASVPKPVTTGRSQASG
ncbi:MAG TPA: 5-amino-6-(D-ribitylamino)uracil--L-tyrosine 4-hydroxyphenyl transferase CofH [Actinomycetota bacterium]|nr:5-amino-6-(D-ribitylamino)uracil--L-tyrosine 4-hydroxyphenyl transferase CofH [Actinomycetota bacterium]